MDNFILENAIFQGVESKSVITLKTVAASIILNSIFFSNFITSEEYSWRLIQIFESSVSITNSTFTNNSVVFMSIEITITNSSGKDDKDLTIEYQKLSVIYSHASSLNIVNSNFTYNVHCDQIISTDNSSLNIINNTLANND